MNYWNVKSYKDFLDFVEPDMVSELRSEGIFNITLKNWKLLDPLLYTLIEMSHAIFRGVESNTYALEPSIFRRYAFIHAKNIDERNDYIARSYNHFVEALRGRRGPFSKPLNAYNRYELWSLGRHFGVMNNMLDWSHSPYVCLFFAFSKWYKDGIRSLFCLKQNIIEETRISRFEAQSGDEILLTENPDFNSLVFYRPLSDENFRMINQQGLFTVSNSPHTIEQWVSHNYKFVRAFLEERLELETDSIKQRKLKTEIDSNWILLKIDIITTDQAERKQILKKLNRMNINYATLFPDVEGASLYANMQGDIHHY